MKIAQVTPYDYQHPGGVAEHIEHLRTELIRGGHEVTVLSPRSQKGGLEINDGHYGIGRTVNIPGNGSRVRLTFDVTLYSAVKELLRQEQFDVVHLHEPLTPVLPYMVLLNSKAVNLATFHAARVNNPWYTAFKPYMQFVLGRLDGRIAVSDAASEFVSQYFDAPYEIIPNGIDTGRYSQSNDPFDWAQDGAPRILFVGRFNEQRKGFKYLLRALPMIQQQYPTARLVVVGPGEPGRYRGLIERDGIRGVDFVGRVSKEDLPRYYRSCDVVCAPSIERESFGLVLLEAMASGKPVVASNITGYAGVMDNGREGLLVEPRSSAAIAMGVVRLLSDSALCDRLARCGLETSAEYAWPKVAARVLASYQTAMEIAVDAKWRQE